MWLHVYTVYYGIYNYTCIHIYEAYMRIACVHSVLWSIHLYYMCIQYTVNNTCVQGIQWRNIRLYRITEAAWRHTLCRLMNGLIMHVNSVRHISKHISDNAASSSLLLTVIININDLKQGSMINLKNGSKKISVQHITQTHSATMHLPPPSLLLWVIINSLFHQTYQSNTLLRITHQPNTFSDNAASPSLLLKLSWIVCYFKPSIHC